MTTEKLAWGSMMFAAVIVGAYALANALIPGLRGPFVENMLVRASLGSSLHFLFGSLVIVIGGFQFNRSFRNRHPVVHRWLGRAYVAGVMIGGLAGLYLAMGAFGGLVSRFGFSGLALTWLYTTGMAWRQIRNGNVSLHRQWMIRSYALTLAAVTLRIYLLGFEIGGYPFEEFYPLLAWLCWVPNILVAEWLIIQRTNSPARQTNPDAAAGTV